MAVLIAAERLQIVCEDTANVLAAQSEIGRVLRDGTHPPIKVLESRAGWGDGRFARYFPANPEDKPTQLPMGAVATLVRRDVLPGELLDMLLPEGAFFGRGSADFCPEAEAERSHDFLRRKTEAHHPDSPAGRDLSEGELAELQKVSARKGVV